MTPTADEQDSIAEGGSRHYALGSEDEELARLDLQGRTLAPATRTILSQAGITSGMRVLDLGCGAGDMAFVVAEIVGQHGSVVGVDRSPQALARARERAERRGLRQTQFLEADIHDPTPGEPFDAIVGRLVLMYVSDPALVLRRQARVLRPEGRVVPIEFDITTARALPQTQLVSLAHGWLTEAFMRGGIHPSLGPRLWAVLLDAGLRPLGMTGVQPHFGPDDPDGAALLSGIVRSALPLIERTSVATAEEIQPETLRQRMSDELRANSAVFAHPILMGAWATSSR